MVYTPEEEYNMIRKHSSYRGWR